MRLIDADKFEVIAVKVPDKLEDGELVHARSYCLGSTDIAEMIDEAPTVDAIPVRHAYIIRTRVLGRFNYCVCSNCHTNISPRWKVCPACSTLDCITLMDGEPKDEDVPDI